MMISSVVLVTVIAMSLNVMLTSAKISRNVIREYGNSNGSRHAADKILSEAQHAYAALSRVDVDGTVFTAHEDNTLIIAKYRTDASGTIVPNSRDLFIYQVITAGPRQQLWEIQAKQLDGMPAEGVSKKMVADNLRKFHYRLSRHETLSPVAGVYGSPMNLVSGEPSGKASRSTTTQIASTTSASRFRTKMGSFLPNSPASGCRAAGTISASRMPIRRADSMSCWKSMSATHRTPRMKPEPTNFLAGLLPNNATNEESASWLDPSRQISAMQSNSTPLREQHEHTSKQGLFAR